MDTNGAGDTFVGAFFAALGEGSDLHAAVKLGNQQAGIVITKSGVVFDWKS